MLLACAKPTVRQALPAEQAGPVSPQPVPVRGPAPPQELDFAFVQVEFHEVPARPL